MHAAFASNTILIISTNQDYIILLRHGESEANVDPSKYGPVNTSDAHELGYGDPNVRLSALGIRQVCQTAHRHLPAFLIFVF
jgi:broad specificity phosphatase PhoE